MQKLTLTLSDDVYQGLQAIAATTDVNIFVESLVRPFVLEPGLVASYRQAAADEAQEQEAHYWCESLIGDVADDPVP